MGKRHRNLIDQITTWENLLDAYRKTSHGKRRTWGYLEFKEYDLANLLALQAELKAGTYERGPYREFLVYEPKPRLISALEFKDRLVQHALCNIVAPIFEASLLPYTYACRPGKGTHAGVCHVQAELRRTRATHFLKSDFSKFFPSINRAALYAMIDKKIHCAATRRLLRVMLPDEGVGIPIGSLTSQLFANVYGGAVDRLLHDELKQRHWARYMDDIVVLGDDPEELRAVFYRLRDFASERLGLKISHWQVAPVSRGINFLGYRIWPTHKLLRKSSVKRAKRKVANFIKHGEDESLQRFLASWSGHAQWADTYNLFTWMEEQHGIACH
ncbi:reverse transcriptase domain-containing protein [Bordetella hinzii]|uniref:reverse transcriptase domain-containing protein n=1 Tax=Bordetella hinzii TaxID=103855 RepID=UPI0039FD90C9